MSISLEYKEFETEQEREVSTYLLPAQKKFLHNLLVESALEKINMPVDTANVASYAYRSEYLRGQIDILQHILALDSSTTS